MINTILFVTIIKNNVDSRDKNIKENEAVIHSIGSKRFSHVFRLATYWVYCCSFYLFILMKEKLLKEIENVLHPFKFANIENGTATERTRQVVSECLWFISLIQHSSMDIKIIKKIRDNSWLAFQ